MSFFFFCFLDTSAIKRLISNLKYVNNVPNVLDKNVLLLNALFVSLLKYVSVLWLTYMVVHSLQNQVEKEKIFLKIFLFFTKYTLFGGKNICTRKKSFILKKVFTEKNFFYRGKYIWKCKKYISFEKYIFIQKMFALQIKYKYKSFIYICIYIYIYIFIYIYIYYIYILILQKKIFLIINIFVKTSW